MNVFRTYFYYILLVSNRNKSLILESPYKMCEKGVTRCSALFVCGEKGRIMAIKAIDNMLPNGVASLACDTTADLADLPTFAQQIKCEMGSTCLCIQDSSVRMMKSDGTWEVLG